MSYSCHNLGESLKINIFVIQSSEMRYWGLHTSISGAPSWISGGGVNKAINNTSMEAKNKETYEAPTMLVVEVKTKGIVCASQTDYLYGGLDEDD